MIEILIQSFFVGIITLVIGTIIFNLSINKINDNNKNKPQGIKYEFFITCVILHILLESFGFNKWYCDKKLCYTLCNN